jgi:hypothetical protein
MVTATENTVTVMATAMVMATHMAHNKKDKNIK